MLLRLKIYKLLCTMQSNHFDKYGNLLTLKVGPRENIKDAVNLLKKGLFIEMSVWKYEANFYIGCLICLESMLLLISYNFVIYACFFLAKYTSD